MLVTLALLVFSGAILILFSQEFIRIFKKIFAIKGAKLFLPLFIASWLALRFDNLFLLGIDYYRDVLNSVVLYLSQFIPFRGASSLVFIILLTVISVAPVFLLNIHIKKKTFKSYEYPYLTSTILWIISAVAFLIII